MESARPFSERVSWREGAYGIDYLQLDRLDEGSVMSQPIGWVLLIYGHLKHTRAWHEVFETRDDAMRAGEQWFLGLDIVPWD